MATESIDTTRLLLPIHAEDHVYGPESADFTLVGEAGRYGVVRHGTSRDRIERMIDADDLATVFHG